MSDSLEKKWDRIWPPACGVVHAFEACTAKGAFTDGELIRLILQCERLRGIVNDIPKSSSDQGAK